MQKGSASFSRKNNSNSFLFCSKGPSVDELFKWKKYSKGPILLNPYFLISKGNGHSPITAPVYSTLGEADICVSALLEYQGPVLGEPRQFLLTRSDILILKDRTPLECYSIAAITIGDGLNIVLPIVNNRQQ